MGGLLKLMETRDFHNGKGFIFSAEDGLPILTTDTKFNDLVEGKNKWKIGVSVGSGCSVGCIYCFTNQYKHYRDLSCEEIVGQVDWVYSLPGNFQSDYDETKIEMKEMGDPTLNPYNISSAITSLEMKYDGLLYVISTSGVKDYTLFDKLKKNWLDGANIRLQFSCHTTDNEERKVLSPKKEMMTLEEIAGVVSDWYEGDRVTLTFVPFRDMELSAKRLYDVFDPSQVFVKISYVDYTNAVKKEGLRDKAKDKVERFVGGLSEYGFTYAYRNR